MSEYVYPFELTDDSWTVSELIHNNSLTAIEARTIHQPTGWVLATFTEKVNSEPERRRVFYELLRRVAKEFEPSFAVQRGLVKVCIRGLSN